jgi:uncharacterized protein involved in exopolysaccharide biosynthesis
MNRRLIILLCAVAAILVFAAGLAYTAVRHVHYQSTAELVLVPTPSSAPEIANLTSSFDNSGTLGTYVEYISSINPEPTPSSPPVSVSVRGVPDTRAISVTTTGARDIVQGALQNVITLAQTQAPSLNDAWSLHVLKNASPPSKSGPSRVTILLGSALIGLLAAILLFIGLERLNGGRVIVLHEPPVEAWYDSQ